MKAVVDANVIIHSRRGRKFDETFTVPGVLEEMKRPESKRKADSMNLRTENPGKDSLRKVKNLSEKINSPTSETDERLAALALSKKLTLVTDDKALQNLAEILDIDYIGFMEKEIERSLEWSLRCSNCGEKVMSPPCHLCGSEQIRRKSRPYN